MSAALIDAHRLHGAFELLPICAEKAEDVAQPLQVSPPLSNSSPLCTMFQGGSSPKWNRIIIHCADCVPSRPILHVIRANQHGNAMAFPTQNHLKREAEEEWPKKNGDHASGENPIMIRREQDGR
jgi:hypothetical protein